MTAPARDCALRTCRRVFESGAYADRALRGEARGLSARDRALATRLAFGAIQRRGTLDHLIAGLADRPVERLDAHVLAPLRLGLYELLYAHGAPDRAVVDDAVTLTKGAGRGGDGLVNAVLRRAAREREQLLASVAGDDTPEQAAIAHSHPSWLARMWFDELGAEDARALMAADNEPAELALRVNSLRADPETVQLGVPVHRDALLTEALVVEGPFDAHSSRAWAEGAIMPQSRASMLVARVLDPRPGERILDLCSAPGGKATHAAALMGDRGEIVAVERHPGRADALRQTCARMGAGCVQVVVGDAAQPREDSFDRVLVDPPCSGLGTLQARADLRWRVTPEAIADMAGRQEAILDAAAQAVRPGGVLVYSTCTISSLENERRIAAFLDGHPAFSLASAAAMERFALAGWPAGMLRTMPHRDGTAGFFIARLRRAETIPADG